MKDTPHALGAQGRARVDLETGAVVAVTLQGADRGDTTTIEQTLTEAAEQLEAAAEDINGGDETVEGVSEVVTDKGYHSNRVLTDLKELGIRSYISEPDHGRRNWKGKEKERRAVYGNRRRIGGARGKRLTRLRGERVERSFAHCYETGAMRRVHLRGRENILKRLLIHVGAFNLSLALREALGAGTPRGLAAAKNLLTGLAGALRAVWTHFCACLLPAGPLQPAGHRLSVFPPSATSLANAA